MSQATGSDAQFWHVQLKRVMIVAREIPNKTDDHAPQYSLTA